jgi:hypothetical protein
LTRRRGEQGTALVEAAIIIPLLMLLTFGAIELGIGFSQKGALESIARTGGRTGATLAGDTNTSLPSQTLNNNIGIDTAVAVNAALATTEVPELNRLVVYRINGSTGISDGPSSWGGSCGGPNCITFPFDSGTQKFDTTAPSGYWPPEFRDACSLNADRIVVRVEGRFAFLTNLIGSGTINLTASSVHQLEPTNC